MKTTVQYLNEAKEQIGIKSDNAFAKHLKIARSAISQYQHGHRVIDDYAAVRIAEILGINPMDVIAAANYEREKAPERKDFWRKMRQKWTGFRILGINPLTIFRNVTFLRDQQQKPIFHKFPY